MPEDGDAAASTPSPPAAPLGAVRFPHYYLAHYALREIAFNDPVGVLTKLVSPSAPEFLQAVHLFVTEFCKRSGQSPDFKAEDIAICPTSIRNFPVAVLQMPEARHATEAHFVALVGLYDVGTLDTSASKPTARYFTLEKSVEADGKPGTVFGEWKGEYHINYGPGPAASLHPFLHRIEAQLAK
jgi:hypothetical protein